MRRQTNNMMPINNTIGATPNNSPIHAGGGSSTVNVMAEEAQALARDPEWEHDIVEQPRVLGVEAVSGDGFTIRLTARTAPQRQDAFARLMRSRIAARLRREGIPLAKPPVVAAPAASARSMPAATATPFGTQTFHLVDAMAYAPDQHNGHKMYVRGLLIKLPGEQRMTISSFEMVSPTCSE